MNNRKVFYIDSESFLTQLLVRALKDRQIDCFTLNEPSMALTYISDMHFNLAILDIESCGDHFEELKNHFEKNEIEIILTGQSNSTDWEKPLDFTKVLEEIIKKVC